LRSDFRAPERALTDLKKEGCTVAVSLKKTGLHQIAHQLRDPAKLSALHKIVTKRCLHRHDRPRPRKFRRVAQLVRDLMKPGFFSERLRRYNLLFLNPLMPALARENRCAK